MYVKGMVDWNPWWRTQILWKEDRNTIMYGEFTGKAENFGEIATANVHLTKSVIFSH